MHAAVDDCCIVITRSANISRVNHRGLCLCSAVHLLTMQDKGRHETIKNTMPLFTSTITRNYHSFQLMYYSDYFKSHDGAPHFPVNAIFVFIDSWRRPLFHHCLIGVLNRLTNACYCITHSYDPRLNNCGYVHDATHCQLGQQFRRGRVAGSTLAMVLNYLSQINYYREQDIFATYFVFSLRHSQLSCVALVAIRKICTCRAYIIDPTWAKS